jgi:hypothetical protein
MKHTINGFVHAQPADKFDTKEGQFDGFKFTWFSYEDMTTCGYSKVTPANITFEIPESFNPRAEHVSRLEEKAKELQAEFEARMTEIRRQISEFTALEFVS